MVKLGGGTTGFSGHSYDSVAATQKQNAKFEPRSISSEMGNDMPRNVDPSVKKGVGLKQACCRNVHKKKLRAAPI